MNVQDYRAAGFNLSNLLDTALVERAESDVVAAYIVPIKGSAPTEAEKEGEPLKTAIMTLSFLLMQQRTSTMTRAGVKSKLSEESTTPTYEDVLRQHAPTCVQALRAIDTSVNPANVCSDICGVFLTTNYFYTN